MHSRPTHTVRQVIVAPGHRPNTGMRRKPRLTAVGFHQVRPRMSNGCSAITCQSRPGKGLIPARISTDQLVNHQNDTWGAVASSSSCSHNVGDTYTGPNTWPGTTSSPQAV
jgi:hypothetical protein